MATLETLEGTIPGGYRYHYDVQSDVLYLRLLSAWDAKTIGDLTDDGDIVLLDETTDAPVGLTVIHWWKRFGTGGTLPDSLAAIEAAIAPLAGRVAA